MMTTTPVVASSPTTPTTTVSTQPATPRQLRPPPTPTTTVPIPTALTRRVTPRQPRPPPTPTTTVPIPTASTLGLPLRSHPPVAGRTQEAETTPSRGPAPRGNRIEGRPSRAPLALSYREARRMRSSGTGVVLVHDRYGWLPHLDRLADDLRADGHTAATVNLYHGRSTLDDEMAMRLLEELDVAEAKATIVEAAGALRRRGAERIALVGFSIGGRLLLLLPPD